PRAADRARARRHHEALGIDGEDLARRPAALVTPWLEQPQTGAAPRGMRPGLRIAAADQVVHLGSGPPPVDRRVHMGEEGIVRGAAVVLRLTRRATLRDELHAVEHGVDTEREELLEVQAAGGVVRIDGDLALQQHRPGVDARIGPEYGDARACLA